jgi:hypothetical protein
VLAVPADDADAILAEAKASGLHAARIGSTGGDAIALPGETPLPLARLRAAHEGWLPGFMDGEV